MKPCSGLGTHMPSHTCTYILCFICSYDPLWALQDPQTDVALNSSFVIALLCDQQLVSWGLLSHL